MSKVRKPTKHLVRVYESLVRTYGVPKNEPDYDPLGGLVATILSQHTSDINSDRAYKQLITTFPTWEDVRDAPTNKITAAIKCGGLANIKSIRIQDVLYTLTEQQQEQGETRTLAQFLYDELARRSTEEAWHYLRELPGVGPKTAACVLLFNLDRPAFPIEVCRAHDSHNDCHLLSLILTTHGRIPLWRSVLSCNGAERRASTSKGYSVPEYPLLLVSQESLTAAAPSQFVGRVDTAPVPGRFLPQGRACRLPVGH